MGIQQLHSSLTELISLHKQLNEFAEEKKDHLMKQNIKGLETVVRNESKVIHRLQIVEAMRVKTVSDLFHSNIVPIEQQTVSAIIDQLEGEEKSLLTDAYEELVKLVHELKIKNEQNQMFIQDALQFVQVSLDVMAPSAEDFQYTAQHGETGKEVGRSLFDSKA